MGDSINVPKVIVYLLGLGVASYALFYIAAGLRNEVSKELKVKAWYR